MKLHLQTADGTNLFTAYEDGYVAVNGVIHRHSLIVTPNQLNPEWQATSAATVTEQDFAALFDIGLEIILLGTGTRFQLPPPPLTAALAQKGIGLEAMDTFAACRTYNILAGEGRKVAAALILSTPCPA